MGGLFCHYIYCRIVYMGAGWLYDVLVGLLILSFLLISVKPSLVFEVVVGVYCIFQ